MGNENAEEVVVTESPSSIPVPLSTRKSHGRAANVVAELLRTKLYVPNVFFKPKISGGPPIDVLAVDRAGSGDLHGVEIKILAIFPTRSQMRTMLQSLKSLPFHFKYLALPGFSGDLSDASRFTDYYPELFDVTGIGRIGIISFDNRVLAGDTEVSASSASITIRPERFLLRGEKLAVIESFLTKAKPDMEVRI